LLLAFLVSLTARAQKIDPVLANSILLEGGVPALRVTPARTVPDSTIRVRLCYSGITDGTGRTQPLYVVDGKVWRHRLKKVIDPQRIASIDILKGEKATLLYGPNGRNGVIIITTKKMIRGWLR
jgi:TonB-dependent SusC/RagA subfamily outer membrane receptor